MGLKIPLGRIAGIKVDTDLTVPVLAALYTATLAAGRFPAEHPGFTTATYWVAGTIGALLFFASLLIHELAHALVAREEGIGVLGISLWFLGGMARLESSPQTAAAEFRIAVVGPLSSAATGIVFLCSAFLLGDAGLAGLFADLFQLLGLINLVLAGFNLIPAAPLDGGTVLAAFVWRRTGSQARGLRVSAIVGLIMAAALVWRGLLATRTSSLGAFNGWIIIFVGAFIGSAAFRTLRAGPLYDLLDGVTVADAMRPVATVARASQPLDAFIASLPHDEESDAFPVVDDHGLLMGVLTADAVRAVEPEIRGRLRVDQLAFRLERLIVVHPHDALLPALQRLGSSDLERGIVVDADGTVIGSIDTRTLTRAIERRRAAVVPAS